ncbi:MAG: LysR substrate-binding domain-containing protein [Polyangiaceae bacterium]
MTTLRAFEQSSAPHPFTLRQLQYVVAVADALSFRRAAERCRVSQPSLSAQLAQVEGALGVRVFERDRRRVLLTTAGRELVDRARAVLRAADDLVTVARRSADPFDGTLRIGVIPTISAYLLPTLARALHAAYPRLTVLWVEDKTPVLVRTLESGALDAALVALEADLGDALDHAVIGADRFVLATPIGHPLGSPVAPARASELAGAPVLLLDDGHCFREQALAFCSRAKARELEFRATSLSTLAQMVTDGAGVTLLPELAVPTEATRADLAIRPFADPGPKRTIALVWRTGCALAKALEQIAGTARTAYAARGGGARRPTKAPSTKKGPARGRARLRAT